MHYIHSITSRWKIRILHRSFHSSSDSYTKFIDIHTHNKALQPGRALHARLIINGLARSTRISTKLISFYVHCKQLDSARKLFDKIPKSNIRGWVAIIGSYARYGFYQEALNAFYNMRREGLSHDRIVIPSVIKACGHLRAERTGKIVHNVVMKNRFEVDAFVATALIDMYSKCGMIVNAKRVFDRMLEKDLVALNAMVSGYAQNGLTRSGFDLVEEMKLVGLKPDLVTWNALIAGFSQENNELIVDKIFERMEDDGVKPNIVSWTSVISGFVQNSRNKDAFSTFRQMLAAGLSPTSATICSILPACANIADIIHGIEIHGYAVVMGFEEDIYVRSALIDMYAKCGMIAHAESLFLTMPKRNTATLNSMIFGYANHGYCHEAVELFNEVLREEEWNLDHLTFTAVFTACSHAGMVHLGQSLFLLMQDSYGIVPRLEHYACMVDLLGRAGNLDEAYDLICKMPFNPDEFVWGALLGACRQHENLDLAEIAAKKLATLEPESAGSSMLLSSLYANSGRWGNATKVKKIKKRKLIKFSSCSWIEVV